MEQMPYTYELVVVWASGEMNYYPYHTKREAENGEWAMRMANGNQIEWTGIRRIY